MDSTQISYQHSIDIYPDIIISAEFISDILICRGFTIYRLHKVSAHGHTEPVIDVITVCLYILRTQGFIYFAKHLCSAVEREELPVRVSELYSRLVVQLHAVGRAVIGCEISRAVIIIIAVIVYLHQPVHIGICLFSFYPGISLRRAVIFIKKVVQRR